MKKILIFASVLLIGLNGMAQGKSKDHKKDKAVKYEKHSDGKHHDNDDYRNRENNNGKYSKNQPAKVRAAFKRDYPNATNVSWTKNSGNWTATFPNGIYRVNATYSANGQRLNHSRNNRRTTSSSDGSIWDKILSKQ